MSAFTPGLKLHDRYLLDRRVGSGGMAEVWQAHDLVLGRPVAVKVLAGPMAADPALRAGALREARSAAQLTHPHITAVHDFGEVAFPDGHVEPYLVMELLTGESLADLMARGPVPWPRTAAIGAQVASALAAAHARDVVHRDIKPGNIMITPTGAKVLDFGISAMTGLPDATGALIIGTPAYAAPERISAKAADPAADVYALGLLLIEMVTGRRHHGIDSWEQFAAAHARTAAVPPLPGVPPAVAALIAAAVDPSPARRPRAADLAQALGGPSVPVATTTAATAVAPNPTLLAPTGGAISGAARVPSPPTRMQAAPRQPVPVRPPKRSRTPVLAVALVMAIIMISGVLMIMSALREDPAGVVAAPTPSKPRVTQAAKPSPTPERQGPLEAVQLIADLTREIDKLRNTEVLTDEQLKVLQDGLGYISGRALIGRWNDVRKRAESLEKRVHNWAQDAEDDARETLEPVEDLLKEIGDFAKNRD
ncbi:serine/threonine-protein kinase [Catellatospora bangladeshensis]|uniref:non-specific serine/threonine protein kinase n=1 Tax=Catellatospora bangladeshensis TaxID=310355 RepID=A0A8J3NHT1_9ACTN|nr:serine/threonine-protein kinase [Catellatospora bangladeshensis]GIF81730.1 protein kinase [Catellatospora bangladeshensis]